MDMSDVALRRLTKRVANLETTVAREHKSNATNARYDGTASGLTSTDTQSAVDELTGRVVAIETLLVTNLEVIIDGGGAVIGTGVKADVEFPFAGVIEAARVVSAQTGDIVLDLWVDTYANFPPAVGDSICASAKPTLSAAQKSEDTTLTGWTTTVNAGAWLRVNVDSAVTVGLVTLSLTIRRTT